MTKAPDIQRVGETSAVPSPQHQPLLHQGPWGSGGGEGSCLAQPAACKQGICPGVCESTGWKSLQVSWPRDVWL